MSATAVLLCSGAGLDGSAPKDAIVVDDLCERPAAAAAALRGAGASRVVLGVCERRSPAELEAALGRAGAAPFGVATVAIGGRRATDAARLVEAARARLDALPSGERGRPTLNTGSISRRTLLSPGGVLTQAPIAVLDETACAGTSRCGLCIEGCPAAAVSAATPFPTIDPTACDACGRCVPRCPRGALRIAGAGTAQIEAQLEQLVPAADGVVFACAAAAADAPAGWGLVELPTLALVSPGWILQLAARGVEVQLAPCGGPCCAGAAAVEECAELVLGLEVSSPAQGMRPIRLAEPGATAEAVRALAPPDAAFAVAADAAPLGVVRIEEHRCTLCGACATACPAGALDLDESGAESVLRLTAAACVACSRCATACPEDALAVSRGIDLERLAQGTVDLVRAVAERCRSCGVELPPRPMRRRLRELVPTYAGAPLDLCAGCAARDRVRESPTIAVEP